MTWHVSRTRSLIESAFGREQLNLARPSLKSVADRLDYARYHYQEAMRLVTQFAERYLAHQPLIAVIFSNDGDERFAFEELMTQLGAHTIACVQSIHTLPDILGHLFYFSLGLNRLSVLKEQNITAAAVRELLQGKAQYSALADALEQLTGQGSFGHLAALANHSKHRSIVQPQLNEDLTGLREDRHEVRFSSFTYKGTTFPEVSVKALLEPEYARCSQLVVRTGEDLNDVLAVIAP